jgi:murein DD-endopeptidase MepM/ murein hydrolase activator NlpD
MARRPFTSGLPAGAVHSPDRQPRHDVVTRSTLEPMNTSLPRSIRGHGHRPVVVAVVLVALVSLVWPAGAAGAPVAPVPVGVWPLQPTPTVVRGFEPPDSMWGAGHRGVDLAGTPGQVVHTALAGRVSFAGPLAGRGVVVVDHGATRTTYEPVAAGVRVGEVVARGQPIGTLELAGSHCLPRACLHWGWKRGATYLDPLLLVGGGPVVLLPLDGGTPSEKVRAPPLPFAAFAAGSTRRDRPDPPGPRGRRHLPVRHHPLAMWPLLF